MRFVVFLVGPLATVALAVAFGWPVLLAGFALALGTLLFSTADTEAGESSYYEEGLGQLKSSSGQTAEAVSKAVLMAPD